MYNMYSWDQPASPAEEHTEPAPVATAAGDSAANGKGCSPVHAVQVALDRRDNGGDAAPRRGH